MTESLKKAWFWAVPFLPLHCPIFIHKVPVSKAAWHTRGRDQPLQVPICTFKMLKVFLFNIKLYRSKCDEKSCYMFPLGMSVEVCELPGQTAHTKNNHDRAWHGEGRKGQKRIKAEHSLKEREMEDVLEIINSEVQSKNQDGSQLITKLQNKNSCMNTKVNK